MDARSRRPVRPLSARHCVPVIQNSSVIQLHALLRIRIIHISPSCWTIYRSFEIIFKTGAFHWIVLQIQCSVQIRCFKKHSLKS